MLKQPRSRVRCAKHGFSTASVWSNFVELSADKIFRALASPVRLRVLRALYSGSKRLSEVANLLGVSPEQLMYHLKQLKNAQLVSQVNEFYTLTDLGRRVYSLVVELEVSLRLAEHEPLVFNGKGAPIPLRLYLQALAFWIYGVDTRSRRGIRIENLLEEVSSLRSDAAPELSMLLLSLSQLIRERKTDVGRVEEVISRRYGVREKSSRALEILSETRLYDFVLLKLASAFMNPDNGVSLVYVPTPQLEHLRTLLRGETLPSEIVIRIPGDEQSAPETLGLLAVISRFLRTSIVLHAEALDDILPELERILEETVRTYPLLIIHAKSSNEFSTTTCRYLTQMINRGVPVLFSFQELVPSAGMFALEIGEDAALHLGSCTVLGPELASKSRILGKELSDLLEGLAPGIIDLFKILKRKASLWSNLIGMTSTETKIVAQITLAGAEVAYTMLSGSEEKDKHLYDYQLVERSGSLLAELKAFTEEKLAEEGVRALYTFFSPRETITLEKGAGRWVVNNISPFTLVGRSFEETLALESRLHTLVQPAPSILEIRFRELSAVQLEHTLRSLEKLGVRLFTVTKTGITYCEECGNIFGGKLPRCPRCQSVRLTPLVRVDLSYTPSTELLPGYAEEAEARGSAEHYFTHESSWLERR